MESKQEVLKFCNVLLNYLLDNINWDIAILKTFEEVSPAEYEKLFYLLETDSNWNKGLNELIKFNTSKEAIFCFNQLSFMIRTGDEPIGIVKDIEYGLLNNLYM